MLIMLLKVLRPEVYGNRLAVAKGDDGFRPTKEMPLDEMQAELIAIAATLGFRLVRTDDPNGERHKSGA